MPWDKVWQQTPLSNGKLHLREQHLPQRKLYGLLQNILSAVILPQMVQYNGDSKTIRSTVHIQLDP